MKMRRRLRASDVEDLGALVRATGFFTPQEEAVARELAEENLAKGDAESGYHFLIAEPEGAIAGYACYGPVPMTQSGFDLYWIVVAPAAQRRGLGAALLAACEAQARGMGGARLYAETSSRALYAPTQRFYEKSGFMREARLIDFYAPGDDKLIYTKRL